MRQNPELIQLTTTDDATSIRDRLSFLRGRYVLLVWPESGTALTRKLDLVLIQREAARLAIRLALVTHDASIIRHAAELDISTFETIGGAQRGRWKRGSTRAFSPRDRRPAGEPDPDELMPVASRLRDETQHTRRSNPIVRIVLLLVIVAVIGGVSYVFVPSATVTLQPMLTRIEVQPVITADPSFEGQADIDSRTIPALTLRAEVEERATVETTGTRSLGASPAVGSVVFINTNSQPIEIPAGTFVSTSAGTPIIFRTTQPATVPGGIGLQIEVPIEAVPESAGEIGNNLGVGIINTVIGELAGRVEVRNFAPTYGGTSSSVRAVTEDDRQRLLDILRQQIQARAYTEMLPRITDTQIIIPETIRIVQERDDWTTFDFNVGDVTDNLSLTMRAVVEATAVELQYAQQIAYVELSNQVPRGRIVITEMLRYQSATNVTVDLEGRVTFTLAASAWLRPQYDPALIAERLTGRPVDDAARYLSSTLELMPESTPQIVITPDWFGTLPVLPMRITVTQTWNNNCSVDC